MAPQGQYHRRGWFRPILLGVCVIVAASVASVAFFREELLWAMRTLEPSSSACSCPAIANVDSSAAGSSHLKGQQSHPHHPHDDGEAPQPWEGKHKKQQQPVVSTTYADLTILDQLPPANVLWVKETGTADAEPEAWGISMFHALHCVKMWKESLNPATMMESHVHSESEYSEHATHCINYLIQSIVCAADGTIEPSEYVVDGDMRGRRIHGMGYEHQCRDTGLLFEMNGKTVDIWDWKQGETLYDVFA